MSDEREGILSGSQLVRVRLCPASMRLERGLPSTSSDAADEGRLLHAVSEGTATPEQIESLNEEQRSAVVRSAKLKAKVLVDTQFPQKHKRIREERFWINDPLTLNPICSGRVDDLYISEDNSIALICDEKYGRAVVNHAKENDQLLAYAIAVWQHFGCNEIYVAIVQPRVPEEDQVSIAKYNAESLNIAFDYLLGAIEEASRVNAPRIPGLKQCRYCRARENFVCQEGMRIPFKAIEVAKSMNLSVATGEQLREFLLMAKLAEKNIEDIEGEIKRRLNEDPASIPGVELRSTGNTRNITDMQAVFQRLLGFGVSSDAILGSAKLGLSEIDKLTGGKEVTKSLMDGVIVETPKAKAIKIT